MSDTSNRLKKIFKQHSGILLFFPASLLTAFVYSNLNKYVFYFMVFITVLYCVNIFVNKYSFSLKFFNIFAAAFVIVIYASITFGHFYPRYIIQNKISTSSVSPGWDFYNAQTFAFKKFQTAMPVSPSEKLKKFANPYDRENLNKELDYRKNDFVLDFSYYKEKYYIYFGVTPVLVAYLPFLIITGKFITDAAVVLIFSIFAFLGALIFLNRLLEDFKKNTDFVFNILKILCLGMCCGCPFLISTPRVYEVAVICASFFGILSYLFLFFYLKNKSKRIFLFFAGFFVALAVGARPFYVFAILTQIFVFIDFKRIIRSGEVKKSLNLYAAYFIPILIYGSFLALYNILRFDNPFEFGHKFGLFYGEPLKTPPEYLFEYIKVFLFFKPVFLQNFPYVSFDLAVIQKTLCEPYAGIVYLIPALFLLIFGVSYFRNKNVLADNKKIAASMLFFCAVIIIVISQIAFSLRYMADVAFYFIICFLVFSASLLDNLKGVKFYIMRFFVIFCMFASIVFSCAAFVSYSCQYGLNKQKSVEFFQKIV